MGDGVDRFGNGISCDWVALRQWRCPRWRQGCHSTYYKDRLDKRTLLAWRECQWCHASEQLETFELHMEDRHEP